MSLVENQAGALSSLCTTSPSFGPGPRVWAQACHISRNYWDQTSGSALSPKILFIKIFGSGMATFLSSSESLGLNPTGRHGNSLWNLFSCKRYQILPFLLCWKCRRDLFGYNFSNLFHFRHIHSPCSEVGSRLVDQMNAWDNANCPNVSESCPKMPCGQKCLYKVGYTSPTIDWVVYGS